MIARMTNDTDEPWVEPDPVGEPCECQSCTTGVCTPVVCPPFGTVTLTIDGTCDCQEFLWPGNPDCPVHGDLVRETVEGWNAAVRIFESAWTEVQEMTGYNDNTDAFKLGWQTAVKISMNIGAELRAQEPGVARVPR